MNIERKEEMLIKDLETIQQNIFDKIPRSTPFYHIIINLPYEFKTYDIGIFADRIGSLLILFEKHLLNHKRQFYKYLYDFDAFCEDKKETEPWHFHILGTFLDQSGVQVPFDVLEDCMQRACAGFKKKHKLYGNVDCMIQLIPYNDIWNPIYYCTKELIDGLIRVPIVEDLLEDPLEESVDDIPKRPYILKIKFDNEPVHEIPTWTDLVDRKKLVLHTDRIYTSQTLFYPPKPRKNRKRNKNQRKTRAARTYEDLAGVLRTKYSVEIAKNARRTQIKL